MKNGFFSYSKDRKYIVNLLIAIGCFLSMLIVPTLIALYFHMFIKNEVVCSLIGDIVYIAILYLLYKKDLDLEAKIYFKDFKKNFKYSFKIYILGFMGMIIFNLFITLVLKNISQNESQVRDMLYSNVFSTMISISIIAPIMEELIFRKSIQPLVKNKWLYALICGLLFGGAHILTNILSQTFAISDLLYILPYGSLGASFALMDYDTKTTFSSIFIHALHNTCTAAILLITFFGGK